MTGNDILLRAEALRREFTARSGFLGLGRRGTNAVNGVSLEISRGETLALVGESGCGKSTVASLLTGLDTPTSGRVLWKGDDITAMGRKARRQLTSEIQIVFQDPYGSLNRRMRVFDIIAEPMQIHRTASGADLRERVFALLRIVGLGEEHADRKPHAFSGGQRQRIGIARALALNPQLLILDEPVSALDVSVQAQILNLLKRLQATYGLSYLFISHDLSVVRHMADRVAVMYLGQIVEEAATDAIFTDPRHPYTQLLLSAIPNVNRIGNPSVIAEGEMPDPGEELVGCSFRNRCPIAVGPCAQQKPGLEALPNQTESLDPPAFSRNQNAGIFWQARDVMRYSSSQEHVVRCLHEGLSLRNGLKECGRSALL